VNLETSEAYVDEVLAWRREKDESLRRRDGWLALAGLHWLAEGTQSAGSGDGVDIRLPASVPRSIGVFEVRRGQVSFRRDPSLQAPIEGERPTVNQPDSMTSGTAPGRLPWS
jgi:uncharacterized protein (DUF1684 family)